MNGINNNISNANYNSLGNRSSNNGNNEEESFFEKALDSIKDFFTGDDESEKESKPVRRLSGSELDKAAYLARLEATGTYTMATKKDDESLTEKWKRENENVELKQKKKEIVKLENEVGNLKTQNKRLTKDNEEMIQLLQMSKLDSVTPMKNNTQENVEGEVNSASPEEPIKKTESLPTHTSIPRAVLEKQQNEIANVEQKPVEEKVVEDTTETEVVKAQPSQEDKKA